MPCFLTVGRAPLHTFLVKAFRALLKLPPQQNLLSKYGKEHFPIIMSQIICKGFDTTKGFALGMFLETNPTGQEFLLAPYVTSSDGTPKPSDTAEPIRMTSYKFKLPHDLTQEDFEYFHWHKVVRRTAPLRARYRQVIARDRCLT